MRLFCALKKKLSRPMTLKPDVGWASVSRWPKREFCIGPKRNLVCLSYLSSCKNSPAPMVQGSSRQSYWKNMLPLARDCLSRFFYIFTNCALRSFLFGGVDFFEGLIWVLLNRRTL